MGPVMPVSVRAVRQTPPVSESELPPRSNESETSPPAKDFKRWGTGPRARRVVVLVTVVALAVLVGIGITHVPEQWDGERHPAVNPTVPADTDGDGLVDEVEKSGWTTRDGSEYRTDPSKADSDGDGLWDGDEAGELVTNAHAESVYYGYSNPMVPDTDGDGLNDANEADIGLDPFDPDSDDDKLADGPEVDLVGSDPATADTDGDGFQDGYEDLNRESQGLDPLWVDVKVGKWTYAGDYAKGALAGDLWREDSLAWLAGNLTSGAASSVPVVGSAVGAVADLRDAVGSAIHADWVGSGFSAVGAVPGGDVVAIPGKAAKFVARNPKLIAATAKVIVSATKVPDTIKVRTSKEIWKDWDGLVSAGTSDKALLTLQKGRTNLDGLALSLKRPGHVEGVPATFFATGTNGESFLESLYGANAMGTNKQVRASTTACGGTCSYSAVRIFDVFVGGVAHESKVGYVPFTQFTQRQIRKDAWLIKNGDIQAAHWHFFASSRSNTIGADKRVLDLLDEQDIPYTIHAPR